MRRFLAIITLLGAGLAWSQEPAENLGPGPKAADISKNLVEALPREHMSHEPVSEGLMRRTLDNYLRSLDYDRSIFLADDILSFRKQAADLQAQLEAGDLSFAFDVFELYKERAADRVEKVLAQLEAGFELENDETYIWKRKDASWAEDEAAWDDLWRKKTKHEYVGLLVSQELRKIDAEKKAAKADAESDAEATAEEAAEGDAEKKAEVLSPEDRIRKRYEQFVTVLNSHDSEYVQGLFLNSMAQAYDTHSSYLSPRNEEDFDINMKLSLTGIGAILTSEEGAAKIERLMKGGPAQRDGRLQPGDKIIAVAQEGEDPVDILYWPLYKSVRLIRGEKGSTVYLHVIPARDPTGSEVEIIDIVRDEIKLEEKAAKTKVIDWKVGEEDYKLAVLLLPDFYADFSEKTGEEEPRSSSADVRRLLEELDTQDVDGMVFDLRNNGGGSLRDCVEMTGYFIDRGPVVQVKSEQRVRALGDPDGKTLFKKPLVILVNRLSASASEILAAALQDHGRAVVVGDMKTHGKGSVQSLMPLNNADPGLGALKVTTAKFYRIDGRSTQLKGVSPDIHLRSPSDVMEMGEEYLDNVLPWSWVAPMRYAPVEDLRETNEVLREKSAARLADDEEFQKYLKQIDRLAERVNRREVPLSYQARLDQALADRELDRLREEGVSIPGGADEEEENADEEENEIDPEDDLILAEGLNILVDWIEHKEEGGEEPQAPAEPKLDELIQEVQQQQEG